MLDPLVVEGAHSCTAVDIGKKLDREQTKEVIFRCALQRRCMRMCICVTACWVGKHVNVYVHLVTREVFPRRETVLC